MNLATEFLANTENSTLAAQENETASDLATDEDDEKVDGSKDSDTTNSSNESVPSYNVSPSYGVSQVDYSDHSSLPEDPDVLSELLENGNAFGLLDDNYVKIANNNESPTMQRKRGYLDKSNILNTRTRNSTALLAETVTPGTKLYSVS